MIVNQLRRARSTVGNAIPGKVELVIKKICSTEAGASQQTAFLYSFC